MGLDLTLILLMGIAMIVAVLSQRLRLPYTVVLVLAGLILGGFRLIQPLHLTRELLFSVFLPGLLFEAAFHLDFTAFRRHGITALFLAVPGVVAAMFLTGAILVAVSPFGVVERPWILALVFGALIAATDPIAVVALFRSLGAPARLSALLEGESLLNDGTSVVLFGLIAGIAQGAALSPGGAALQFVTTVGIGAAAGGAIGFLVAQATRRIDHPMIEITLTTLAAYAAFVLAERIHGSGVIATVAAGMLCGGYGRVGMRPTTRVAVESFWEYVAFAFNSLVFLLIGFEVQAGDLIRSVGLILPAFGAVLAGRAVVVFAASLLFRGTAERLPWRWSAVLTWGGLRGALSLVLALSLPPGFPQRDTLVALTSGVVILSILLQGFTMAPLLRGLRLTRSRGESSTS